MRAYKKKVHPRRFREGDLVLKMILPFQTDHRGKWTPNYEGPFVVKNVFSGGVVLLTNIDGVELKKFCEFRLCSKILCMKNFLRKFCSVERGQRYF